MELDFAVAELAEIGEAVEIEIGEEEAETADEEETGADPFEFVGLGGEEGVGEERAGERDGEPAGDVVHEFRVVEVFVGLAGGEDVEIGEGVVVVGATADDSGAVFEDEFAAEIAGDDEEAVPGETNESIDGEGFSGVFIQEHSPGHEDDESPGGDVGHEFVPFNLLLGDSSAAGPDFGVDAADKGDEEEESSGGGDGFCGEVAARGAGEQAGGIEDETGEEQDEGELHELWVEIA